MLVHTLRRVPVVTLMPHSRCNCRCIMCDIWKANRAGTSLDEATVERLLGDFERLGVRWIVLSGGEALMHANLWALCEKLKLLPVKITLLTSGLLLARHGEAVVRHCDEVIVSLDGAHDIHNRVRGIKDAYQGLADGVAALRQARPGYPVSARCVVQRANFRHLHDVVAAAKSLGLNRISFLAADISSTAFNRPDGWTGDRVDMVALSAEEARAFQHCIEDFVERCRGDFASGFIAESPEKMRRIAAYYLSVHGLASFPRTKCNAPWVSAVVESDGAVRPCFFHPAYGNLADAGLLDILNSPQAIAFRRNLDVRRNEICRRCVCTLNL